MKKQFILFAILLLTLSSAAFADVKIKSKQTISGQSYENTTYIKGKRQRSETMGGMMTTITQCDLRRDVQLNAQTKTYVINAYDDGTASGNQTTNVKNDNVVRVGGTVTMTVTVKDTGERKQMFGFTARRLIITIETASSPDSCSKTNTKMQTDGWYIDAEFALDCDRNYQNYHYNPQSSGGGCRDKFVTKQNGTAKRGYPVYEKMTMFDENGKETMTMTTEVVELSKATLSADLFDVPQDYKQVSDASQMYAAAANYEMNNQASGSMKLPKSGENSNPAMTLPNSGNAPAAVGAKKAGTIRIGVSMKTGAVGEGISANDLAAAVQNTLGDYLKGTDVEIIVLEAKLTSALESEAKQKECDYVLTGSVSHKKGGGGFGFGKIIGQAVAQTGIGNTGSTAGNIAGQVATNTIVSAGQATANIKPKDEITLDLSMKQIGGAVALTKQFKQKAKSAGEDIISPVVEQAANAIVEAAKK